MARRVHRASHSSMLEWRFCLQFKTSEIQSTLTFYLSLCLQTFHFCKWEGREGFRRWRVRWWYSIKMGSIPVRSEHHSASVLNDAHDGVPEEAAGVGVHSCGGLILQMAPFTKERLKWHVSMEACWEPPGKTGSMVLVKLYPPTAPGLGSQSLRWRWKACVCSHHCRCRQCGQHTQTNPASGWPTRPPDSERER